MRYRVLHDGRRQVLNIVLPGDFIGFPGCFFDSALYSIATLSEAVVSAIPFACLPPSVFSDIYRKFCRHPSSKATSAHGTSRRSYDYSNLSVKGRADVFLHGGCETPQTADPRAAAERAAVHPTSDRSIRTSRTSTSGATAPRLPRTSLMDQPYQAVPAHRFEGARQIAGLPAGQRLQFRQRRGAPLVDDAQQPAVRFRQYLRQRLDRGEPDFRLIGPATALPISSRKSVIGTQAPQAA
jgi:hypothetical protein